MTKNVFWTKHETQKQQKQQQNKQANTQVCRSISNPQLDALPLHHLVN